MYCYAFSFPGIGNGGKSTTISHGFSQPLATTAPKYHRHFTPYTALSASLTMYIISYFLEHVRDCKNSS